MKISLAKLKSKPKKGHLLGGRIRTSTVVLLVAFVLTWWAYDTYRPEPAPHQVPAREVVPPGYVPDPLFDEDALLLPTGETHAFWVTVQPSAEVAPDAVRVKALESETEPAESVTLSAVITALARASGVTPPGIAALAPVKL